MSANSTLSGREQARAHRQGQKSGKKGKATSPVAPVSRPTAKVAPAKAAPVAAAKSPARRPVAPAPTAPVAVAGGRAAAKQARHQQKSGKVSQQMQSTPDPRRGAKQRKKPENMIEQKSSSQAVPSQAPKRRTTDRKIIAKAEPIAQSGGRNVAKAWRQAGAQGRVGQDAYKSKGSQSGALAKMANPGASTRDIAKKIRAAKCTRGSSGCAPVETASAKRVRQSKDRGTSSLQAGESKTLSGETVSGTTIGQGKKVMTGAETGACKVVSGTEYLGAEEFSMHCDTTPDAKPAKITMTQTTRGQTISGNEVGSSKSVTGDAAGQCSSITGTEYIPADQSALFCGADTPANPTVKAFSVMSPATQATGGSTVTGGEGYKSQSTTIRPTNAPQKVVMSQTAMGNMTSGTQVGRLEDVTGTEAGSCKSVTGTGYQSVEEAETLCDAPAAPTARKVIVSGTQGGQFVTGDRSGGNVDMTGAEAGSCQSVSGTAYMGTESLAMCSADQQAAIEKRQRMGANHAVSGVQPGPIGLTGAQKGACSLVSGTHYQGDDQTSMVCNTSNVAQPGESDFPQMMGSIMSTPSTVAAPQVAMPVTPAPEQETGSRITGDGWDRGTKVTGTEGPWAAQRNASIRGAQVQAPMGASQFRPAAMEEVPQSPITGSAGNTQVGAKVTLSGGSRA
ncbi:MAG: CsoS2 family carboxysome shell protein [Pseudomonadota bacterium]|nr:CsoS2 family carboxysome shell protein [Pseudomonadota bacterium]